MKMHGVESSQAAATPVMVFVPPGPVVTRAAPKRVGVLPVRVGGDGAGLLVQIADVLDAVGLAGRIHQVHGSAAGQHEEMLQAGLREKFDHVVR